MLKEQKYLEAIKIFNEAISAGFSDASIWYFKGDALAKIGKYKESIECFNKSIEINSKNIRELKKKIAQAEERGYYYTSNKDFIEESKKKILKAKIGNAEAWGVKEYLLKE